MTTIRRRSLLAAPLLATGAIVLRPERAAAAPAGDCRAWCLSYCDTTCRGTKRPACPGKDA